MNNTDNFFLELKIKVTDLYYLYKKTYKEKANE